MKIDSQRSRFFGAFDLGPGEWKKPPSQKFAAGRHPYPVFHFTQNETKLQNPKRTQKRENTTKITKKSIFGATEIS